MRVSAKLLKVILFFEVINACINHGRVIHPAGDLSMLLPLARAAACRKTVFWKARARNPGLYGPCPTQPVIKNINTI